MFSLRTKACSRDLLTANFLHVLFEKKDLLERPSDKATSFRVSQGSAERFPWETLTPVKSLNTVFKNKALFEGPSRQMFYWIRSWKKSVSSDTSHTSFKKTKRPPETSSLFLSWMCSLGRHSRTLIPWFSLWLNICSSGNRASQYLLNVVYEKGSPREALSQGHVLQNLRKCSILDRPPHSFSRRRRHPIYHRSSSVRSRSEAHNRATSPLALAVW